MGQKTNINSLKNTNDLNYTNNLNQQTFINIAILTHLKQIFKKRGVLIISSNINKIQKKVYINLIIFFTKKKINQYKKRKKIKKRLNNFSFIFKILNILKSNLIYTKIVNLNKSVNKNLLVYFFKNLNKNSKLFEKHQNFFLDFIKITTLFCQEKIKADFLIIIIGTLFSFLKKKNHNRFFRFLELLYEKIRAKNSNILGIKTLFSGKILGKTMASNKIILNGNMPIQSIKKYIVFERMHIYTIYGVFGLKLWIHKKNINKTICSLH